jgi:hypothetical protein
VTWLLLCCVLVAPVPDPPQPRIPLTPAMQALMWGIPAAHAADLLTTQMALNQGGLELNPLMRRPETRYPLSLAATGLGMWGTKALYERGHPNAAKTAAIMSIVIPLIAAGWNLTQMK